MQAPCGLQSSSNMCHAHPPAGNCLAEIKQFCSDITVGEGRIANCISDQISESETADTGEGAMLC